MARSSARRNKAAHLRFAKLPAFSFIQAIVDVWEEARLNSEERLVSMFMCVRVTLGRPIPPWLR